MLPSGNATGPLANYACAREAFDLVVVEADDVAEHLVVVLPEGRGRSAYPGLDALEPVRQPGRVIAADHRVDDAGEQLACLILRVFVEEAVIPARRSWDVQT